MQKITLFIITSLFTLNSFATEYDCDKKYCKAMVSCDEAYYKLKICDDNSLDRDGDGVPCENVCGKGGKKQIKNQNNESKSYSPNRKKNKTKRAKRITAKHSN